MEDKPSLFQTLAWAIEKPIFGRAITKTLDGATKITSEECASAVLTAIKEAGMVIVPREPTPDSIEAGRNSFGLGGFRLSDLYVSNAYRAMITAGEE